MNRISLILVGALALAAASLIELPAGAAPPSAPAAHIAQPYQPFPVGHERATLTWIRNNVVGMTIGPNVRTGYGRATISSIVKGCPECEWYRIDLDYAQSDPTFAQRTDTSRRHHARREGFCWPWENYIGSGCASWNSSWTWDWVGIWDTINGDWHPWDSLSTVDRFELCAQGVFAGVSVGVIGKGAIARFIAGGEVLKVTPAGAAYSTVSGCIANLFAW
jgi:hypothetical protein